MTKLTIDFRNNSVTVNDETCNFYEAGIYQIGENYSTIYPQNENEFKEEDYDNYLQEKHEEEIEFEFIEIAEE